MAQEVATAPQAEAWRSNIQRMENQFARALPQHITPERFIRAAETAIMNTPDLRAADQHSLMGALMMCAETGLMPNGRDGAIVTFNAKVKGKNGQQDTWIKKAQFIPMIGGILRLMRNTGEIATIIAEVVKENDAFDYQLGDSPFIQHKPALKDRGETIAAYAVIETKDGAKYRDVMSKDEIEKVMSISRARDRNGNPTGPWKDWPDEMAKKTVLRRLAKKAPLSTDRLEDLTHRDDALYDLSAVQNPPSKNEAIASALRSKQEAISGPIEDVEVEDVAQHQDTEPGWPEEDAAPSKDEPQSDAVFDSEEAALAELQGILNVAIKIEPIDNYMDGWKSMVASSFPDTVAPGIVAKGQKFANTRKLEIQKKAAGK